MKPVKLGKNQEFLLSTMSRGGQGGFPGYGWVWSNYSTSVKLLNGLVKLGLVAVTETPSKHWKITPLGLAVGKGYATLVKS